MKFGVNAWSYPKTLPVEEAMRHAKSVGYAGYEVAVSAEDLEAWGTPTHLAGQVGAAEGNRRFPRDRDPQCGHRALLAGQLRHPAGGGAAGGAA